MFLLSKVFPIQVIHTKAQQNLALVSLKRFYHSLLLSTMPFKQNSASNLLNFKVTWASLIRASGNSTFRLQSKQPLNFSCLLIKSVNVSKCSFLSAPLSRQVQNLNSRSSGFQIAQNSSYKTYHFYKVFHFTSIHCPNTVQYIFQRVLLFLNY